MCQKQQHCRQLSVPSSSAVQQQQQRSPRLVRPLLALPRLRAPLLLL